MKIIEFHMRITKFMKMLEFQQMIIKKMKILQLHENVITIKQKKSENHEHHDNPKISQQHHENY